MCFFSLCQTVWKCVFCFANFRLRCPFSGGFCFKTYLSNLKTHPKKKSSLSFRSSLPSKIPRICQKKIPSKRYLSMLKSVHQLPHQRYLKQLPREKAQTKGGKFWPEMCLIAFFSQKCFKKGCREQQISRQIVVSTSPTSKICWYVLDASSLQRIAATSAQKSGQKHDTSKVFPTVVPCFVYPCQVRSLHVSHVTCQLHIPIHFWQKNLWCLKKICTLSLHPGKWTWNPKSWSFGFRWFSGFQQRWWLLGSFRYIIVQGVSTESS